MSKGKGFWLYRDEIKRPINAVVLALFVFSTYFPMGVAMASPSTYARPGLGISRLPLEVMAFDAPGFGQLNEAINVANGNLYVGLNELSFNSQSQPGATGTQSASENMNQLGKGNGWNFTQRLRLEGFTGMQNQTPPNLFAGYTNMRLPDWQPYWLKPNTLRMIRLLPNDGPTGCPPSGLLRLQNIPAGRYLMTLDARSVSNTLDIGFGINDFNTVSRTINTSWQTFTQEFNLATASDRLAQVFEATANNPAWEVGNIRVQQWNGTAWGPNLVLDQDDPNFWWDYCSTAPREIFFRLQSADFGSTAPNFSGVFIGTNRPAGTYMVSFQGRTRNGTLPITYGLDDGFVRTDTLTTSWRTYTGTFTTTTNSNWGRHLQIVESTASNPDWEIQDVQVRRVAGGQSLWEFPSNLFLGSGDGSGSIFTRVQPGGGGARNVGLEGRFNWNPNLDSVDPGGIPSWVQRYKGLYDGAYSEAITHQLWWQGPIRTSQNQPGSGSVGCQGDYWGWMLAHCQGDYAQYGVPQTGRYKVVIRVSTSSHNGIWPIVSMQVNGVERGRMELGSQGIDMGNGLLYDFGEHVLEGGQTLRFVFTNDDHQPGVSDRNVSFADVRLHAATSESVAFYGLFPVPGLSYAQEWLVLLNTSAGRIAHYYDRDGTRYTFFGDGDYVDYIQSPYQQQRAAAAGDTEGLWGSKTQIDYTNFNSGLVSRIQDEWGRTTVYNWEVETQRLNWVNILTDNPSDPANWMRRIEFGYGNPDANGRYPLTRVTYRANNYRIADQDRTYEFSYNASGQLTQMRQPVANGTTTTGWRNTDYTYENGRIKTVAEQGKPTITYNYNFTTANAFNGPTITQTQTSGGVTKTTTFLLDNLGQLRRRTIADINPNGANGIDPASKTLQWDYTYYQSGNLGLVTEVHNGKTTHFRYDAKGNVLHEAVYQNRDAWANQGYFPPLTRIQRLISDGTTAPERWVLGTGSTFSIEATVERDVLEEGLHWSATTVGTTNRIQLTRQLTDGQMPVQDPAASSPVVFENQNIVARSGRTYTIRANFRAIANPGDFVIRAWAVNQSQSNPVFHEANLNVNRRYRIVYGPIANDAGINKLIVAPNCLRYVKGFNYEGGCRSEIEVPITIHFEDWVPSSQYQMLADAVNIFHNASGLSTAQRKTTAVVNAATRTASASAFLSFPWQSGLATQDVNIQMWAQPSLDQLPNTEVIQLTLGYFGTQKVRGRARLVTDTWFPNETKDGALYPIMIRVFNSPGIVPWGNPSNPNDRLRVNWRYQHNGGAEVGAFGVWVNPPIPGCFGTWPRWPWEGGNGWVHAEIQGYPQVTQTEHVEMHAFQMWREGEACLSSQEVNHEGTVNGLQTDAGSNNALVSATNSLVAKAEPKIRDRDSSSNIQARSRQSRSTLSDPTALQSRPSVEGRASYDTQNHGAGNYPTGLLYTPASSQKQTINVPRESNVLDQIVTNVRAISDPAVDLDPTLRDQYETARTYNFDADNRVVKVSTYGAQSFHPVTAEKDVLTPEVHQNISYTNHQTTVNGQMFRSTDEVIKRTFVGGSHSIGSGWILSFSGGQHRRTERVNYDEFGRLHWSSRASGENTELRTTTYTYWQTNPTSPLERRAFWWNGGQEIRQWGDLVRAQSTTSSTASPVSGSVNERYAEYQYDHFGNPVVEMTANTTRFDSSTNPPTVKTDAQRFVNRHFDGWGNKIYEEVRRNNVVESLQSWSFFPTGEPWSQTVFTDEGVNSRNRTTRFQYNGLGQLLRLDIGLGSATEFASVSSGFLQTKTFIYDAWGRVSQERHWINSTFFGTNFTYDTLDREASRTLPDGSVIRTWYDNYGEISKVDEPKVTRTWERTYNNSTINVGGQNYSGFVFTVTERAAPKAGFGTGYEKVHRMDEFGRTLRTAHNDLASTPAERNTDAVMSKYGYDAEGWMVREVGPRLRLGPDAGANPRWYGDNRRTGAVYTYDNFGRRVGEQRVLYGDTTDSQANLGSPTSNPSQNSATTQMVYDNFDQLVRVVDALGYRSESAYDGAGRAFMQRRGVQTGATPAQWATTWSVFDGADRQTHGIDPEGAITEQRFDAAGNLTAELNQYRTRDASGNLSAPQMRVIKGYVRSPNGFLTQVWEPRMGIIGTGGFNATTFATFNPYGPDTAHFVNTEQFVHNGLGLNATSRKYANTAWAPVTTYTYNWQGKPTSTVLPADAQGAAATITQAYDYQGNQTSITDADGFTTTSTYDYNGKLLTQHQQARSNNAVDTAAKLDQGLRSSYTYDGLGNLIRKNERGLVTDYVYNALGKVIAESRPTFQATEPTYPQTGVSYKKSVYRLDGQKMAETSYTYADSSGLANSQGLSGGLAGGSQFPTFTHGSLQIFRHDLLGNVTGEFSYGFLTDNPNTPANERSTAPVIEKEATYTYNGLGLRLSRDFTGDKAIYANQRDPATGTFLGQAGGGGLFQPFPFSPLQASGSTNPLTRYYTFWEYDLRGKLTASRNEVDVPNTSGTATARGVFDTFSYQYSPTGKEMRAERDVQVRVRRTLTDTATSTTLTTEPVLAATVGRVDSNYNERDLLSSTSVFDRRVTDVSTLEAAPTAPQRRTTYTYYIDGSKNIDIVFNSANTEIGRKTYTYDNRTRVTRVVDSNGTTVYLPAPQPNQPPFYDTLRGAGQATIDTKYTAGGQREEKVTWAGGSLTIQDPASTSNPPATRTVTAPGCTRTVTTTSTVGGLTATEVTNNGCVFRLANLSSPGTSGYVLDTAFDHTRSLEYNTRGLVVKETTNTPGELRVPNAAVAGSSAPNNTPTVVPVTEGAVSDYVYRPDNQLASRSSTNTRTVPAYSYNEGWMQGGDQYLVAANVTAATITNTYSQTNHYNDEGHLSREESEGTNRQVGGVISGGNPSRPAQTFFGANVAGTVVKAPRLDSGYTLDSRGNRLWVRATRTAYDPNSGAALAGTNQSVCGDGAGEYQAGDFRAAAECRNPLLNDYIKRYDADDRVAMFYRYNATTLSNTITAGQSAYSDFRYDPQGNQVLSSSGSFSQNGGTRNSYVGRDYSASYFSNGEVQLIRKNSGNLTRGPTSCTAFGLVCNNPSNDHNSLIDALKDQTFSLADGLGGGEAVGWAAPTLFDRVVPETGAVTFQAPDKPISAVLSQPVDVKPANTTNTPGSSSTPTDVKPPTQGVPQQGGNPSGVEKPVTSNAERPTQGSTPANAKTEPATAQSQTVGQGQAAGTVQNVGTVAAPGSQPATANTPSAQPSQPSAAANTPSTPSASSTTGSSTAGVKFEAPQASPLPPSVQAVSPQEVTAPNQATGGNAAIPSTGNAEVTAPNRAAIPQTSANPQDGPLGVAAPASIAVPNMPPVSPDGGSGVGTVAAPPGWKPSGAATGTQLFSGSGNGSNSTTGNSNASSDVDEKERRDREERERRLGEEQKKIDEEIARLREEYRNKREELGVRAINQIENILDRLQGKRDNGIRPISDPAEQLALLALLQDMTKNANAGVGTQNRANLERSLDIMSASLSSLGAAKRRNESGELLANQKGAVFNAFVQGAAQFNPKLREQMEQYRAVGSSLLPIPPILSALGLGVNLSRFGALGKRADNIINGAIGGCNSFSPETKVRTAAGLVAIASITEGTEVLAYNEQTGKNEYRPVTKVITQGNTDKQIAYVSIDDTDSSAYSDIPTAVEHLMSSTSFIASALRKDRELIIATYGHPFYLVQSVDGSSRPKPEGYDVSKNWVSAGDLKAGDKVLQSDGTTGVVTSVKVTQETRKMYNLSVAVAQTYYVGEGQWLVHNAGYSGPVKVSPSGFQDVITKGIHVSVNGVELSVRPGANGTILFKPVFSSYSESEVRKAIATAEQELNSSAALRSKLYDGAVAATKNLATETGALADLARGRSAETNFLAKALEKMGICE